MKLELTEADIKQLDAFFQEMNTKIIQLEKLVATK
jgi:hypothetical protein